MPVPTTYPGVYVQEIPSGVRTITGVSTSVTAFIGAAKRGPINKATRILGFADYERLFGGLTSASEMSYAVRQFFLNGGSEAWVVRLAKNALPAGRQLKGAGGPNVLTLTARDEGLAGNDIEVRVDYATSNPASTFNLTLAPQDNPAAGISEGFENLSMNSNDARYVVDVLQASSGLVTAERTASLSGLGSATSVSGKLEDQAGALIPVNPLVDETHDRFRVSVNGSDPIPVVLTKAEITGTAPGDQLTSLCGKIEEKIHALPGANPAVSGFTCVSDANSIKMTSGTGGEFSSVRVLPGERNDLSARLKLGTANGGTETDAVAAIRPAELPVRGTLTSGAFGDTELGNLPSSNKHKLRISLDGQGPDEISLGTGAAAGQNIDQRLSDVAIRLESAVRQERPSSRGYSAFTCTVDTQANKLVLSSGTRGEGSSVEVTAAGAESIATELHLLSGTTAAPGENATLSGGAEEPFSDAEAYGLVFADRAQRKGIYALDGVDIFNLLCLPGMTDTGLLMDAAAYCEDKRAFLIADSPQTTLTPDAMAAAPLPNTNYGAVYFPWVRIADPLRNGALRDCAPSGTVAGVYARTDSARGVWKAPAGTEATMVGVQAVKYAMTDLQNGVLNPKGINSLRVLTVFGAVVWGARTLQGVDPLASAWKYVPIRRLALFIEETLYRSTQWVVFEPNDEPLWSQIRLNIGAFMNDLFRQGAFQGKTPRDAYFVKCDKETTTQNDINQGRVNIVVGFAPLKPAEFVIIQIQQMAGQTQT